MTPRDSCSDSTRHFLLGNATLLSEEGIHRLHLRGSCRRKLTEGVTLAERFNSNIPKMLHTLQSSAHRGIGKRRAEQSKRSDLPQSRSPRPTAYAGTPRVRFNCRSFKKVRAFLKLRSVRLFTIPRPINSPDCIPTTHHSLSSP